MGWSAVMFYRRGMQIPDAVLHLVLTGGALFTFGAVFHVWRKLRFQNAIWHGFVLLGVVCHYAAILNLS
jgi:hemolysin III